ncbi:hypothetical protein Q31b_26490 [Novipirellula aureliae]|uniref:WXG100 family type VII secretion target n=1 Tax=Novipirellula aureliae TaxID=2527966 RepID=A0A5C6DWT6_9BACT|nr:hypothetical protein [Novipirellula aureliae]TWU41210.1 hypothetical protein Q31b_26490 [Novipirellula aureliae]
MTIKLGPIRDAENKIRRDFIDFAKLWAEVRESWVDDRSRQFEQEHLSSLGPSLNRFASAMTEFCEVIRRADEALADDQHRDQ